MTRQLASTPARGHPVTVTRVSAFAASALASNAATAIPPFMRIFMCRPPLPALIERRAK